MAISSNPFTSLFGMQMSPRDEDIYRYGSPNERHQLETEYQKRRMLNQQMYQVSMGQNHMQGLGTVAPQIPKETTPAFLSNPKLLLI